MYETCIHMCLVQYHKSLTICVSAYGHHVYRDCFTKENVCVCVYVHAHCISYEVYLQ